jgi:hypothetical protein
VDKSSVYWTTWGPSARVMKVPLTGGPSIGLASEQSQPVGLAINAANAFWANADSIMAVSIQGGMPTQVAKALAPVAIAVSGTAVYWTEDTPAGDDVRVVPVGGGEGHVREFSPLGAPYTLSWGIAVDSTGVYLTMYDFGTVMKYSLDLTSSTTLAAGLSGPYGIAVDDGNVYWTDPKAGTVMSVPKTGGAPTMLASGQVGPQRIAVDGTSVYWTNNGSLGSGFADGAIMKVAIGGGAPGMLAAQSEPEAIAVDDKSVYWTTGGDSGTVMKLTPK